MADAKPQRKRRPSGEQSEGSAPRTRARRSATRGQLTGAQLAQKARDELAEITGLEPESVIALDRSGDGNWKVTVELLELARIPETDDVLGAYEAELDEKGALLHYARVDRYTRSQTTRRPGAQNGS